MGSNRHIQSPAPPALNRAVPSFPRANASPWRIAFVAALLARTIVPANEMAGPCAETLTSLVRKFNPQTESQLGLVETMAAAQRRLMRLRVLERKTGQSEIEKQNPFPSLARVPRPAVRDLAMPSISSPITHPLSARQPAPSLSLLFHLATPKLREHNFAIRTQSQIRTLHPARAAPAVPAPSKRRRRGSISDATPRPTRQQAPR